MVPLCTLITDYILPLLCSLKMYAILFVGLDHYIEILDERLNNQVQKECAGIVAKKIRRLGSPSSSHPTDKAPSWAVKKESEGVW